MSGNYDGGAGTSGQSSKVRKSHLQYEHCGYKGHSKDQCYKIVGYLADFKSKRKSAGLGMHTHYAELIQNTKQDLSGNNNKGNYVFQSNQPSYPGAFFTKDQYQ